MKTLTLSLASLALSMPFMMTANAQCGPSLKSKATASALRAVPRPAAATAPVSHDTSTDGTAPSIVGLWDSTFTIGGQVVDEGIEQWHSDGTEILNDTPPPATGNVCLGVWSLNGVTYNLTHPFWIFDQSNVNLVGRGTIQQAVTVAADGNSYSGTFTYQFRDLSGNPIDGFPDESGDVSAVRITPVVPSTPPAVVVTTAGGSTANANGLLQTPFSPLLLDASGSTGMGTLTYEWTATPPVQMRTTHTPGQILVTFPSAGDYSLNLKVTDSQGNTGTYSVTVEFTGNPY